MKRSCSHAQFMGLTPEKVLEAVEAGGESCNNLCYPLNSFENRVYEVELRDGQRVVAKFYRPGRWTKEQILEEHRFIGELEEAELDVCSFRTFPNGETLNEAGGLYYCLADRRGGRAPDELTKPMALRLGMLVGRLHNVGARQPFRHRRSLAAEQFVQPGLRWIEGSGQLPQSVEAKYLQTAHELVKVADRALAGAETLRIHADLHVGNLLTRDGKLHVLDFDDMATGPPVQDLWLAIPDSGDHGVELRAAFIEGYERFRLFDRDSIQLIEPLRALRLVRYACWLARRWDDPAFKLGWPQFGSVTYWNDEIRNLEEQLVRIRREADRRPNWDHSPTVSLGEESLLENRDYFWDWEEE